MKYYIYNSSTAYTDAQIEEWVASRKLTSKTKYMFVASKYNQHGWIMTRVSGKWSSLSLPHSEKASMPICSIDGPRSTASSSLHPSNACSQICRNDFPSFATLSSTHFLNAYSSIFTIESGSWTDFNSLISEKACGAISVTWYSFPLYTTFSGTTTSPLTKLPLAGAMDTVFTLVLTLEIQKLY